MHSILRALLSMLSSSFVSFRHPVLSSSRGSGFSSRLPVSLAFLCAGKRLLDSYFLRGLGRSFHRLTPRDGLLCSSDRHIRFRASFPQRFVLGGMRVVLRHKKKPAGNGLSMILCVVL